MSENQPTDLPAPATGAGDTSLMMIGAAIVIGAWIVFDVIMGEFGSSVLYYAIAALVLMSTLGFGGIKLGNRTMKLLGYFMGVVVVFLLVDQLRYGFPDGVVDNIANIAFYIGFILMFVGARGLPDS